MTEAVATLKGQKLDSRYTLLDKLGAGGQGEVWRAHDGTRGIDVALKIVSPGNRPDEAWSALEHEYTIASRLDHPSILKVFAPHRTADTFVLPMELASGGDLRRLRGGGFLEIIPVLLELAQAMEHAHERGVIHRDLKPGNVLFDARGRVRLADFGVAETASTSREVKISASASTGRDTGGQGFSPFTASPAQLRGEPPTPADDIYGLGALAYELLSGYPPYYPHFDKKRAIEERVPDLVPTRQIPPLLTSLVTRMLAKDPKERPRTMREVIDELDASLNDTLTFDFENVSRSSSSVAGSNSSADSNESAAPSDSASLAVPDPSGAALPSFFAASTPASTAGASPSAAAIADNSTIYLPPAGEESKPFEWSPTAGLERRSIPDRRSKPRDGSLAPRIREPKLASDLSGVTSNDTIAWPGPDADDTASHSPRSPTTRPGSDALARIDAALERAAAMAAAAPPSPAGSTYGRSPLTRTTERSHFVNPTGAEPAADEQVSKPRAANPASSTPPSRIPQEPTRQPAHNPSTLAAHPTAAPPHYGPATSTPTSAAPHYGPATSTPAAAAPRSGAAASNPKAAALHAGATAEHRPLTDPHPSAASPQSTAAPAQRYSTDPHPVSVSQYQPAPATQPFTVGSSSMSARHSPMHATWTGIPLDGLPRVARLEPIKPRRWPWVLLGLLAGGAAGVYFWLPRFDLQALPPDVSAVIAPLQSALSPDHSSSGANARQPVAAVPTATAGQSQSAGNSAAASETSATSPGSASNESDEQQLRAMRRTFDSRLAALEARGAGVWGGRDFATAKTRAAESVGARDAGNPRMAQDRLAAALKLLDSVDSRAPQALSVQVAAGEKALGSGQQEVAGQAFELARRIDPTDRRASDGLRRAQNLNGVLPLLADARNAEAAHDYARAAQDYSQALSMDPGNATAKAGQSRADAAFGDDNYAKAVGAGFAALGAGRLDDARGSFVRARALKPNGAEAADGMKRVQAALTARGFASVRQHAADLEAQERWDDAQQAYEDVLRSDPSLGFAQEGRARAASRSDLGIRLQQLIDRPDRLSAPGVKEDARALLETAEAQSPSGPVLRSQIARLQMLLPGYDKPVRLSLVSDNSTQVAIWSVGSFGAFSRRDIELRPGKYTVVGTRNGFRDVRREITVAPGQDTQTIKVTCSEPI